MSMRMMRASLAGVIVVTLGVALFSISSRSEASNGDRAPQQIRFLNVAEVVRGSQRAKEVEEELGARERAIEAEAEAKDRELSLRARELEKTDRESPRYYEERAAIQTAGAALKFDTEAKLGQLQRDARNEMASIYVAIREVVARYAEQHGIDAVLTTGADRPQGRTFAEVKFEMAVRPVLFARKDLDITNEIIELLNAKK